MTPTLTYFSIRGYGEYIRLLLTDQGVDFVDERVAYKSDEWAQMKSSMAFGQVPRFKQGNKEIYQTGSIMRHLGRVYGLNGSNEDETTFIDMFFEGVRDVRSKYVRFIYYDDYTREETINTVLPTELEKLEKLFKTYANGDHFVAGEKVSYADYILFEELDVYLTLDAHILDKFPKLKAFHERFSQRPNLKNYLAKRAADKVPINAIPKQ
ncbi:unnamed protein product [Caenorhabditis bovis]|uniref:Glutathione S-transferase n=1 Tax=Caenorhabditis bovis TaxID=2654633 RepID=A0A8S1ELW0_9PELO|nr:unnamed protein product [Caenorhabditis bovis]